MPQAEALASHPTSVYYNVLYSFGAAPDGNDPGASLIDVGGTLYGTTAYGGSYDYCGASGYTGCGTLFSLTTGGTEKVLHSFGKGTDGFKPEAPLIKVGGTLYGTTASGGAYGGGTVFGITTSGGEKVLHSFGYGADGKDPVAGLLDVRGILYGTTYSGGVLGGGTVFRLTPGGVEKVLHSFGGEYARHLRAANPAAGLIDVGGTLYGTTKLGGGKQGGIGTVFSIKPSGREYKLLHSFNHIGEGYLPLASLIDANGTLYGTDAAGGAPCYGSAYCGTVFSITTSGTFQVLHSFGDGNYGRTPLASVIEANGTLYGTTAFYGAGGAGAVFSLTTGGEFAVLHSFTGGSDGSSPFAALIDVNGTLYGTTYKGGGSGCYHNVGCGTVFALRP